DGRIEQVGSPHDLYHRPATQFVAGFIGSPRMNFLPATLKGKDDARTEICLANGVSRWVPVKGTAVETGQALTLGVRPDDFSAPSGRPGELVVEIDVDFVEHLGSATYLYGSAFGQNIVARSPDDHFHSREGGVSLAVAPSECHVCTADVSALPRLEAPKNWS